jgi:dTDP-4-amino-4,6-dideoxygalactose transaminase
MYFTHPQFKYFNLKLFLKGFFETDLKNKLNKIFPGSNIIFTDSGRSAFQVAIKELRLENSTMFVPAYICDVFLPIFKKYNIIPIYLDIDLKTFHAGISEIEEKITSEVKSILVCHTYGLPVDLDKILGIAKKYNLKIIEDCAHISPPTYPEKFGDYAFFSFSKICPNINGGMLVSKFPIKTDPLNYGFKLSDIIKFMRLYPTIAGFSEKFRKERETKNVISEPRKASKLSLNLFNYYLKSHEEQISERIKLAKYFQEKLLGLGFKVQDFKNNSFTYLSALVPQNINRDELFNGLRKYNIFCSRIWQKPIYPKLPNTSEAAKRIINFPFQSWFTEKDINRILEIIKNTTS